MDIVYICRNGENEELRYSIRSVVANLPHSNIWLVGGKPDWYTGNFIPYQNKAASKFENIRLAHYPIIDCAEISDNFILMNDDFFILQPMESLEVVHGGLLEDKVAEYASLSPASAYTRLLRNTHTELLRKGIRQPIDYDIHVPMPMDKKGLATVLKSRNLPRSLYGNTVNLGGTKIKDVKTYSPREALYSRNHNFKDSDLPFVSSQDSSFEILKRDLLEEMFPDPSIYEVPLVGIEPTTHRLEV